MTIDQVLTALIYLVAVLILLLLGKWVYDLRNRRIDLRAELIEKDNLALAIAVLGYYLGLVFALSGVLQGEAQYWVDDLIDIGLYGLLSLLLLNVSGWINERLVLRHFDHVKEIIEDQNAGTGIISGANYTATGLMIWGAMSGEGSLWTGLAFWAIGQFVLVFAALIYDLITPFDLHAEIERDNVAVGVAFAGILIGLGNLVRVGIAGDFVSWQSSLIELGGFLLFGLILLPIMRVVTDRLFLPGASLTDELVNQERPNIGAGAIEALSYVTGSILIGWIV